MDTGDFLARVVAPGNYIVVGAAQGKSGFRNRFFDRDAVGKAVGSIKHHDSKGADTYFAMASFKVAETKTGDFGPYLHGERKQSNVQGLRAFWIDMDVSRTGDGKKPGACFATRPDALNWLANFRRATGLPKPSIIVDSGYGYHAYWTLPDTDTLAPTAWVPLAERLKAAVLANGFVGDAGIITDSARVLRPPGTSNYKAGAGAPVTVKHSGPDVDLAAFSAALAPFKVAPSRALTLVPNTGGALAGGGPSAAFAQAAPVAIPSAPAAATHPRYMREIAAKCQQVGQSLAAGGNGDSYPVWYLGHLSLAHHTADGAQYVHQLSSGDPRYVPADVDAAVTRIAAEKAAKDTGPPTCGHYQANRPAACQGCPFALTITSPWQLGQPSEELPDGFRRGTGCVEYARFKADDIEWRRLVMGDVREPLLTRLSDGYELTFTYAVYGKQHPVAFQTGALPQDASAVCRLFATQHMNVRNLEKPWGDFCVAWVEKLRAERKDTALREKPFGWNADEKGQNTGFAVAGDVYRPDGSVGYAHGAPVEMRSSYKENGSLGTWRAAFDRVTLNRPDLQVIVAVAFAAPLIAMTGETGMAVSVYSRQSAVGKSSAMKIGQAVWGSYKLMHSLNDTPNAVFAKIGIASGMPAYWDEMRQNRTNRQQIGETIFQLTQGKGKARMESSTELREVREYETILMMASNQPLMDLVADEASSTNAGEVRVFEYGIELPPSLLDGSVAPLVKLTERHYGHAGRLYAKWLGSNEVRVRAVVETKKRALETKLAMRPEERFYVSGMASILIGAALATHLNICTFDVKALEAKLISIFKDLRAARDANSAVSVSGHYDPETILGDFVNEHGGSKLVTDIFPTAGGHTTAKVVSSPQRTDKLVVHIAHAGWMRIARPAFKAWLKKEGKGYRDVLEQMQAAWPGMTVGKLQLGGTTQWSYQTHVIEIPLTGALASYVPPQPPPARQSPTQQVAAQGTP